MSDSPLLPRTLIPPISYRKVEGKCAKGVVLSLPLEPGTGVGDLALTSCVNLRLSFFICEMGSGCEDQRIACRVLRKVFGP